MPVRPTPGRGSAVWLRGAAVRAALLALCCSQTVHAAPGDLDTSFSADGGVLADFGGFEEASAVLVQPDGKLVAAGSASIGGNRDFALARFHPDGSLDTSFGSAGLVLTDFGDGSDDGAAALAIQPDGKLVAAGFSNAGNPGDFDFAVARYNPDGSLDTSFGGGTLRTFFGGNAEGANALVIQLDGKIVAAGFSNAGSPGDFDFALVRYLPDGSLDTGFGFGGTLRTFFGGDNEGANALVIQSDGKLIAAGFSNGAGPEDLDFALARYNPDGSLDTSFGGGGFRTFLGGGSFEGAEALAIQADGRLVAAGFSNSGGDDDFALTRYFLTDVAPPPPPRCGGRPVTILGTPGNDTIRGTAGPDVILGLEGNDVIRGLEGDDVLCGGPGKDRLIGGPGRDRMFGQGENDKLFGDKGKDLHNGGSGRDRCDRNRNEIAKACERTTRRGRPGDPPPREPPLLQPIAGICNTPGCL